MKIVDAKPETMGLYDLAPGYAFRLPGHPGLWMRAACVDQPASNDIPCVNLENGRINLLDQFAQVQFMDAEIIIK